jgi:hypothetical protein
MKVKKKRIQQLCMTAYGLCPIPVRSLLFSLAAAFQAPNLCSALGQLAHSIQSPAPSIHEQHPLQLPLSTAALMPAARRRDGGSTGAVGVAGDEDALLPATIRAAAVREGP